VATARSASSRLRGGPPRPGGVGILGGTFDPIHLGHLRVAEELREVQLLDQVRLVPAAMPPHKPDHRLAPARDRLRMVERAIAGNAGLQAWGIELERRGPSYSVDTIRALRREVGADRRVVFALGRDAFAEFHTWREHGAIFALCDVVVVTRPPHATTLTLDDFPVAARRTFHYDRTSAGFRHVSGHRVTLQHVTAMDVSASDIRTRLAAGRSVRYLVPDGVLRYIQAHGLYGASRRARPA
jgi:nicotinate-nucleotide adenylyltransferase